jgi:hypothetical protein
MRDPPGLGPGMLRLALPVRLNNNDCKKRGFGLWVAESPSLSKEYCINV